MSESEDLLLQAQASNDETIADKPIYLRSLSSKAPIDRKTVRILWKKGLVAGLFNLPTEAVFEACTDFCIEGRIAEKSNDIVKIMEDQAAKINGLTVALRKAVINGIEQKKELESVLALNRDHVSQILLLEERRKEYEKHQISTMKLQKTQTRQSEDKIEKLERQLASALEDVNRLDSDNKSMSAQLKKTIADLTTLQELNSQIEQKMSILASKCATYETSQQKPNSREMQQSETRISALEAKNRILNSKLKEFEIRAQEKEVQLQDQIQSLSEELCSLQAQNTTLSTQVSILQTENFDLRASTDSPPDQNDILNQRLLSHYRYLVNLTEDSQVEEAAASDGEEWD